MHRYDYDDDLTKALRLVFQVVEASTGDFDKKADWYSIAHALALKLFRHVSTMQTLCSPSVDKTTGDVIVDHSSVNSLTRAAFETFLTFAHIYGIQNKEVARLRFALWQRCGLMDRQKFVTTTPEYLEQIASESKQIEELKHEIEASPYFASEYTGRQRERLIGGEWTGVNKFSQLAKEAGIHPDYFRKIYKFTSGHSHANYISALQVTQARNVSIQKTLASHCLGTGLLILTHFVAMFIRLSPRAKQVFYESAERQDLFERWHIQVEDWDRVIHRAG